MWEELLKYIKNTLLEYSRIEEMLPSVFHYKNIAENKCLIIFH